MHFILVILGFSAQKFFELLFIEDPILDDNVRILFEICPDDINFPQVCHEKLSRNRTKNLFFNFIHIKYALRKY